MIRLILQIGTLLSLVLCCVGLGTFGSRLLFDPVVLPATVRGTWSPSGTSQAMVPAVEPLPLAGLTAVTTRPLFFEGRKLPVDLPVVSALAPPQVLMPEAAAPTQVTLPPTFKLLGVVDSDGRKLALISGATSQGDWLNAGDTIDGWVVTTIERDRVALKQGSQSANLDLYAGARID
jgi:hypothetical protein